MFEWELFITLSLNGNGTPLQTLDMKAPLFLAMLTNTVMISLCVSALLHSFTREIFTPQKCIPG